MGERGYRCIRGGLSVYAFDRLGHNVRVLNGGGTAAERADRSTGGFPLERTPLYA